MELGLKTVAIIEKDDTNDVYLAWSHPLLQPKEISKVIINRSTLSESVIIPFSFSKYQNNWLYIFTAPNAGQQLRGQVVAFSICLVTDNFHPEKYAALCKVLSAIYNASGDPVKVMEAYLNTFIDGKTDKFDGSAFEIKQSYLATSIKDIISLFEEDIVTIWSALLMKKRVAVFCEKLSALLKFIRAMPLLVFHRQDWNVLRPWVGMNDLELRELSSTGVYVAGFTNPDIKTNTQYYDVLIDVTNRTVTVNDNVKEDFNKSSVHQELATYLAESSKDENVPDQAVIKELMVRTKNLLAKLESWKGDQPHITYKLLQQKKLPAGMDNFLFRVAAAEGWAQ
jgi:hypothetical protein